jgi:hypothetical protein
MTRGDINLDGRVGLAAACPPPGHKKEEKARDDASLRGKSTPADSAAASIPAVD